VLATEGAVVTAHSAAVSAPEYPVLLYDERCGVCRRFVAFVVRADGSGALRIAPLHSALGAGIRRRYPEFGKEDSAVWLPAGGRATGFSDAMLDCLAWLGGGWKLLAVAGRLVPRPVRDSFYRLFAANRGYFSGLSQGEFAQQTHARMVPDTADIGSPDRPG
jgi:predicted DCC family thiol-disulfide oxidoreductase YuxK